MNLSDLPEEALVRNLLDVTPTPMSGAALLMQDAEAHVARADGRDQHLSHVLGIARELLLRSLRRDMQSADVISSPVALRDWLRLYCADLQHEVFLVLFLDAQHRVLEVEPMFRGTVSQTAVYPREVVKAALSHNAAVVAFAHNHPSGHAEPSRADEFLTATLKSALALVDIRVIDHFVVAGDQLVSFAERGLL